MLRRIPPVRKSVPLLVAVFVMGAGVGALIIGLSHGSSNGHRVDRVAATDTRSSSKRSSGGHEYQAAPGAASQKSIEADIARAGSGSSGPTASSSADAPLLPAASGSFAGLQSALPGRIELAVRSLGAGATEVLGANEAAHGWSTTKVPVLVALLRARGAEGLTESERQWAQSAITESNNEAVLDLFNDLEQLKGGLLGASLDMQHLLRLSGDNETVVTTAPPPPGAVTTFGQTEWRPSQAVKFFRALALGCLLPPTQTTYVLGLMQSIEPSESWGLGSAGFRAVAFKGGWGPEGSGYLVRQSGIIDPGTSRGAAVAIVAFAPSFGAGTEMLTETASWLKRHLRLSPHPKTGCPTK